MTLATLKGRLQTKILTLAIAGPIAFMFAQARDCTTYFTMFALMIVIGLALEALWGIFIDHEPGWLTIAFGALEFSLIFAVIKLFHLDLILSNEIAKFHEGLEFYLTAWGLTQLFLIYLLPVWRTSWIENGGELW